MVKYSGVLVALTTLLTLAAAHPGEHHDDVQQQIHAREILAHNSKRSLDACSSSLKARALHQRAVQRRENIAAKLRNERSLAAKPYMKIRSLDDLEAWEKIDHLSTDGFTVNTDPSLLFSANASCVLAPEVTQGPYWITGERIRSDVTEDQAGVDMYFEFQFVDITTCEPISNLLIDIWHANATGVYSGVAAEGNGVGTADPSNLNNTFLRGAQSTDSDGVASFKTIFPGHYQGRSTHLHLIAHEGGSILPNNTYSGGDITHVGQIFFEESLRAAVEIAAPYSTNTQAVTTNDEDMWAQQQADSKYDPFSEYVLLGSSAADGIFSWISIGINTTAVYADIAAAGSLTENGGVSNADAGNFGPGAGGSPSGFSGSAFPSGAFPTGAAPSGTVSSAAETAQADATSRTLNATFTSAAPGVTSATIVKASDGNVNASPMGLVVGFLALILAL